VDSFKSGDTSQNTDAELSSQAPAGSSEKSEGDFG